VSAPQQPAPGSEPALRFAIHPTPTPEEEGAIVATITLLSAAASAVVPATASAEPTTSRWALAGREAAHGASPASWGRRWSVPQAWLKRN
jgi:hypothetical protein